MADLIKKKTKKKPTAARRHGRGASVTASQRACLCELLKTSLLKEGRFHYNLGDHLLPAESRFFCAAARAGGTNSCVFRRALPVSSRRETPLGRAWRLPALRLDHN